MANTPQAKKRIRRNEKRADINGARLSRIRNFLKKVEVAIEGGDKDNAQAALKAAQPELCLLYTSPSPRDQRGSRMPSSA